MGEKTLPSRITNVLIHRPDTGRVILYRPTPRISAKCCRV